MRGVGDIGYNPSVVGIDCRLGASDFADDCGDCAFGANSCQNFIDVFGADLEHVSSLCFVECGLERCIAQRVFHEGDVGQMNDDSQIAGAS